MSIHVPRSHSCTNFASWKSDTEYTNASPNSPLPLKSDDSFTAVALPAAPSTCRRAVHSAPITVQAAKIAAQILADKLRGQCTAAKTHVSSSSSAPQSQTVYAILSAQRGSAQTTSSPMIGGGASSAFKPRSTVLSPVPPSPLRDVHSNAHSNVPSPMLTGRTSPNEEDTTDALPSILLDTRASGAPLPPLLGGAPAVSSQSSKNPAPIEFDVHGPNGVERKSLVLTTHEEISTPLAWAEAIARDKEMGVRASLYGKFPHLQNMDGSSGERVDDNNAIVQKKRMLNPIPPVPQIVHLAGSVSGTLTDLFHKHSHLQSMDRQNFPVNRSVEWHVGPRH